MFEMRAKNALQDLLLYCENALALLNWMDYRKSGYFCCRLIFSNFAGQLDSQKYFS